MQCHIGQCQTLAASQHAVVRQPCSYVRVQDSLVRYERLPILYALQPNPSFDILHEFTSLFAMFWTTILPIHYNSQCITFPEWVSLFTLCLAPLIAHIASGTPQVSYLTRSRPKWYDRLCHYNPTSIIWRYAAIADRRVRAVHWSCDDLAASSAIFWTANEWDGGEHMVAIAAPYCSRCPEGTHVQLFSITMLKTTITTLQGLSALFSLIGQLAGLRSVQFNAFMGVDMIFFPLSILGLLRLCAAAWLTEDFQYAPQNDSVTPTPWQRATNSKIRRAHIDPLDSQEGLDPFIMRPFQRGGHFRTPPSSWTSRGVRAFYLLVMGGACALSFVYTTPNSYYPSTHYTATSFTVGLFYVIFTTVSVTIYAFYFFRGQTTTTILPCVSKTWYRIYTFFIFSFMLVMVVIASVETNKGPDGWYYSAQIGVKCTSLEDWYVLEPGNAAFAIAFSTVGQNSSSTAMTDVSRNNISSIERYQLYNFTGYCSGKLSDSRSEL